MEKGATLTNNSLYPPPNGNNGKVAFSAGSNHYQFSEIFSLKSVNLQRTGGTNFSCYLELSYAAGSKTYSIVAADYMQDPSRPGTQIIGITIHTENVAGGPAVLSTSINAPNGIDLASFEEQGLPIIVKEETRPWIDVNAKKGLFYILG